MPIFTTTFKQKVLGKLKFWNESKQRKYKKQLLSALTEDRLTYFFCLDCKIHLSSNKHFRIEKHGTESANLKVPIHAFLFIKFKSREGRTKKDLLGGVKLKKDCILHIALKLMVRFL